MMRYLALLAAVTAVGASGCGLGAVLGTPTSYETKVPAEFSVARDTQGKIAVLVEGGPASDVRARLTDVILLELEKKAGVKKGRLVSREELEKVAKDPEKYATMTGSEVGAAVGAEAVLVVKIVDYGLYPLPVAGYYDGSISVSASIVSVRTGAVMWPQIGVDKEVALVLDAERGDAAVVAARMIVTAGHGVVRYLYDCPKAYFRIADEKRANQWDSY